jgi:hypothetical protein
MGTKSHIQSRFAVRFSISRVLSDTTGVKLFVFSRVVGEQQTVIVWYRFGGGHLGRLVASSPSPRRRHWKSAPKCRSDGDDVLLVAEYTF